MILLSDVHFSDKNPVGRTDNIFKTGLDKLEQVFSYASAMNMPILQAGDLTHQARSFVILSALINLFNKYPSLIGKVYCVYGQHDMVGLSKEGTILSILENIGFVKILNSSPVIINKYRVYGCSWGEEIPKNLDKPAIVVVHKNISDVPQAYETVNVKFVLNSFEDTIVLVGDVHRRFFFEKKRSVVLNTGCLIRRNVIESEFQPCFAVFNGDLNWVDVEVKEGVFDFSHLEIEKEKQRRIDLSKFSSKILDKVEFEDFETALQSFLAGLDNEGVKKKIAAAYNSAKGVQRWML